jgi:uncharacterized SAM-binding protein YcdF (DUF218 family)
MIFGPIRLALKIVGAVLALILLYFCVTLCQVWLTSRQDDPHRAGAILVFGTAANYLTPAPDLEARLDRALQLYEDGLAPVVAVTGGKRPGDRYTEAQISATWLEAKGVPRTGIVEGGGADTWQNVASVAPVLHRLGVRSVLVVTDPFHEYRAMAITSDFGFSPSPTPSLRSPIRGTAVIPYLLKEATEVSVGRIVGYGRLSTLDHSSMPAFDPRWHRTVAVG